MRVGDADVDIVISQQFRHCAAVAPGQSDHRHLALVCGVDRFDDVARVAAGRDRQQHVVGLAQRAHLLGKHLIEIVVVGDRCQRRRIGRERNGRQRRTFHLEAVQQLGAEMLRVGRRPAVAAGQNLPFVQQALNHPLGRQAQRLCQDLGGCYLKLRTLGEVLCDASGEIHVVRSFVGLF